MSYNTVMTGEIMIEPPLTWGEVRDSFFLPENAQRGGKLDKHIMFRIEKSTEETDDSTLTRKTAVALVPTHESYAGNITVHLQEIVHTFPERTFTGRIDGHGEDTETPDVWRLKVIDGRVVKFTPKLVWPPESE